MTNVAENSPTHFTDSPVGSAPGSSPPTTANDPETTNATQNIGPSPAGDQGNRNRFVLLAYCTFFTLLLGGQYLWLHFDRPKPLAWDRGEAFNSFRVDVNNATWVEWIQLPGIGQTTAERILGDIDRNGPFKSIDDLTRVKGIGPKTLDRIRPWLTISPRRPEQVP